ncbi:hypothetical protein [uncultured Mediterranean phage uvMED]|jgi:hypothetical protein|nr:hypothetical protein [uncultured Mediterranean phage uvMED]BAR16782.1 hypothetical protein [uncultured Mediterranean phage uvMED]BAR16809.1 hypothetical protein [uncultured Mediterranean phage uvMED]BAR16873.1 hypothetical protein [uncultured Mediterranean phage uvMED]BAR16909.1 hypothetical protein [uncultured Mediterranean phage uvMED]
MGFMSAPKPPPPDPELVKQREAEQKRLAEEKAESERRAADMERKKRANLLGTRSLQDEELEGFTGYRRKNLGKSVRS